jgi:hypothetical protein
MIRALDKQGDFTFGSGRQNYLQGNAEYRLIIASVLKSFYGDLFFAPEEGFDWLYYMNGGGSRDELLILIRYRLQTLDFITGVKELDFVMTGKRTYIISGTVLIENNTLLTVYEEVTA